MEGLLMKRMPPDLISIIVYCSMGATLPPLPKKKDSCQVTNKYLYIYYYAVYFKLLSVYFVYIYDRL